MTITVLGIETSCDETAAAVVRANGNSKPEILSNIVRSQWEAHAPFAGVVPEIAARAHVDVLDTIIADAMKEAGVAYDDLDAVAATAGPGLIGGLIVGLVTGKALACAIRKPLIAINHLEGHALTARLVSGTVFPYVLLLVSGGHTQILLVEDVGRYRRLGTTIDDALGEAFDKVAKLLGLGFPGGPAVERAAMRGDPKRFDLPRPLLKRERPDFSLAGLKTAARNAAESCEPLSEQDVADICAGFQAAVTDVVESRMRRALALLEEEHVRPTAIVAAGGVAANMAIRESLEDLAKDTGLMLVLPPQALCSDNAAMIAWAGIERFRRGDIGDPDAPARPRWPLDDRAEPVLGSGKAGAKA